MAVQLALLQRLSLIIGHPTTTLALVVATMLVEPGSEAHSPGSGGCALPSLGTGGTTGRSRHSDHWLWPRWGIEPAFLVNRRRCGLRRGGRAHRPRAGRRLSDGHSFVRPQRCRGNRGLGPQRGFSVLGSVAGALGGLLLGSRGLVAAAMPCYVLVWLTVVGALARRSGSGTMETTALVSGSPA